MAIGKIKGPMLFDDLARQGVDLSFDSDLLYLDVTNRRLGVGTDSPQYGLDVLANVRLANLTILGNTITSNTGKIGLGSISNITVTGGLPNYIVYTDGEGNLAFGNLNTLSVSEGFTGNNIVLGTNSLGDLSNALGLSTSISVTDGIALLNQLLGNITDATGSNLYISGNIDAQGNITAQGNLRADHLFGDGSLISGVSVPITISEYFYGDIANVIPHVSTIRFDRATGFTVEDLGANTALISMSSSFKTWIVDGQANLVAFGEDKIKFEVDDNIVITTHPTPDPYKIITFSLAGNIAINGNITGGYLTAINGLSTANAVITGGYINNLANIDATYGQFTNLSSSNVVITGGYINNLANISATTVEITNLSTGNAIITGGYADDFPIGSNVAAPGRFTTVVTTDVITAGGNLIANSGTSSDSVTTGALVVVGGAGISGNVNAGNVDTTQITTTTGIINTLYSVTSNVGDMIANTATIGNLSFANNTITTTGVVVINANTALQIPVGGTNERPPGQNGYIRFNSDTPALEYFDGGSWVPVTNTVSDQFIDYCDGETDTFTLDREASTAGVIVSINGTLQQPDTAYTIVGDQITFTEIPEPTDVIDIRFLGASVSINNSLSDSLYVSGDVTLTGILSAPQQTKASNATGTPGQVCWDSNYIYVCTAPNTWKRTPLTGGYQTRPINTLSTS